MAGKIIASHIN